MVLPKNTFQPGPVGEHNHESMSAATIIETYVQTVNIQPVFDNLTGAPNIQRDQETSRVTARDWISRVRINLYQNNTDLISFGQRFNSYYATLVRFAQDIENETSRLNFVAGVGLLLNDIAFREQNARETVDILSGWNTTLATDSSNMLRNLRDVEAVYEGNQGVLQSIKNEIEAIQQSMSRNLDIIAIGAGVNILGGLMIAIGLLAIVPSGGISKSLVVGGILVFGGGATAIGIAAAAYQQNVRDKAAATARLTALTAEIAVARDLTETLTLLSSQCNAALGAANQMLQTWQVLGTQFRTVHNDFSNLNADIPSAWLLLELETSKQGWDRVMETAQIIQNQLIGIPVQDNTRTTRSGELEPPHAVPRVTPLTISTLSSSVTEGVKQILLNEGSAGGIVNLLVEVINLLKVDIVYFKNVLHQDSLKQSASAEAQRATVLIEQLEKLGTSLSSQLSSITQKSPLDVSATKALFAQVAANLETAKEAVLVLESGASVLSQQAADSIAEWSNKAEDKSSNPLQLRISEARLSLAISLSSSVDLFSSHLHKLDAIIRVLIMSFGSMAQVTYDHLVNLWITSQTKGLLEALRNLDGISAPAPLGSIASEPPLFYSLPSSVVAVPQTATLPSTLDSLIAISTATINIAGASAILARQPNIRLDDVDRFAEQFQLARDHAFQFQGNYVNNLLLPVSEASSLGTFIVPALQQATAFANLGQFNDAIIGVNLIISRIQAAIQANQNNRLHFSIFRQTVADDRSRFVVLEASVPGAIDATIAALNAQAASLQAQIEADNERIARGATDTILRVLALQAGLAVAVAASFIAIPVAVGAGKLTVLAVKGVNAAIQGAAGAAKDEAQSQLLNAIGGPSIAAQSAQRIETLRTTITQLFQLQANLGIFNTVNTQVHQIASEVASGEAQLASLNSALQREIQDFNLIIAELRTSSTASIPRVSAAWARVRDTAPELLRFYQNFSTSP
eukprot:Phypoly_transcript_01566.p1 GENE.Phypoly_transcript_01566~~Phypoly_transcript_01566.p1  ORF type:complete len:972 (+),score=162.81 Phypoly_transcript_01566:234-3149(+)